ncbi:unnamed protein product [Sphagnum tenellum]
MVAALVRRVAGGAVSELAAGVDKAATDGCARTSFAASRTHSGADFYSSEISPQEQVSLPCSKFRSTTPPCAVHACPREVKKAPASYYLCNPEGRTSAARSSD